MPSIVRQDTLREALVPSAAIVAAVMGALLVVAVHHALRTQPSSGGAVTHELGAQERLKAICESVQQDAFNTLILNPESINSDHPDLLRQHLSDSQFQRLWLYDYACRSSSSPIAAE